MTNKVLLLVLLFIFCASLVLCKKKDKVEKCIHHCIKVKGESPQHCKLYCIGSYATTRTLSIFEDNVPITESKRYKQMSDNVLLNIPRVRFDKALFNTPSAFDELVQWTHVLKQQVAANAERHFETGDGSQFHLLPMPIPLTADQLSSDDFMNRLVDVVPDSDLVYKESSPLTFSEAYKQFLLDVKIDADGSSELHSPEKVAKIRELEQIVQSDMDQFLQTGNRCYDAYEQFLVANNIQKISYTFDTFAPQNGDCVAADNHLAAHATHSKQLSELLNSINHNDELFKQIGIQTQHQQGHWNFNKDSILQFAQEHSQIEDAGSHFPTRFQIIVNMIRYYLKREYFGNGVLLEESCLNAYLDFNALGWREISVTPKEWFNPDSVHTYRARGTNSATNYFDKGGVLQRMITKLVLAYKPTLKIVVSKGMKDSFVDQSTHRNFRALEVGPFLYDRVDFNSQADSGLVDTYEMIISSTTRDPQVIGFKSKSFIPLDVQRLSTHEFAFCRRESACQIDQIHLVPLYQLNPDKVLTTIITTNLAEAPGWVNQGVQGYCFPYQHPGTIPLYRYHNPSAKFGNYLVTTNWGELEGGRHGWNYQGVVCYVAPGHIDGTHPYHRFHNPVLQYHTFTNNYGSVQNNASPEPGAIWMPYRDMFTGNTVNSHGLFYNNYEGVAAYLYTHSSVDRAIGCCRCD